VNFFWARLFGVPDPLPWETPRDFNSEIPDDGRLVMAGVTGMRSPRFWDVSARVAVAVPVGRDSLSRADCFYGVL